MCLDPDFVIEVKKSYFCFIEVKGFFVCIQQILQKELERPLSLELWHELLEEEKYFLVCFENNYLDICHINIIYILKPLLCQNMMHFTPLTKSGFELKVCY